LDFLWIEYTSYKNTCWTETKYREYVISNGCDAIEGIYSMVVGGGENYRLALKKIMGVYHLIYLSGIDEWNEGDIKASLEQTATPMLYNGF